MGAPRHVGRYGKFFDLVLLEVLCYRGGQGRRGGECTIVVLILLLL